MNRKFVRVWPALPAAALALFSPGVGASPVTFTLDPTQSTLTLVPVSTRTVGAADIYGQSGAGLVTGYSGTLSADVTAGHITFLGASLTAADSGNALPGPAPSNYGFHFAVSGLEADVALRGLQATATSGALGLSGGAFDGTGVQWGLTHGTASADVLFSGGMASPSADLTGLSAFNGAAGGTLAADGTLTLPVRWMVGTVLNDVPVSVSLQGSLVATSSVVPSEVPVPGALLMMVTGLMGLGGMALRGR